MRLMRSVVGGCVCVVASVVLLSTLTSSPPTGPSIHSIVAQNLKEELEGRMTCDEEDLQRLGFVDGPQLYPHHAWDNLSTPVLASAVWSGQVWQVEGLIGLAQLLLPNLTLVVYSLDLPTPELQQLEEQCNTSCVVVPFDFSLYPSHLRDHHLRAYRPIIIQELLQMGDAGTLLLYNTEGVHRHLMQPWVSCALTHNCISPIGAQDTGCRYDKKPLFRYSGCHHYDASAFNVALGVMFSYDTRPYLAPASPFVRVRAKPRPDSDAPFAGRGEEDEATNTSSLPHTLSRRPSGGARKTERTFRGLEAMHRATRSNGTARVGSRRLGERREREREGERRERRQGERPEFAGSSTVNATQGRGGDDSSRSIY